MRVKIVAAARECLQPDRLDARVLVVIIGGKFRFPRLMLTAGAQQEFRIPENV
jgi:hypothetical protein